MLTIIPVPKFWIMKTSDKKKSVYLQSLSKRLGRGWKIESSVLIKFYEIACESIFYLEQLSPLAIQLSLSMFLTKIHSISF